MLRSLALAICVLPFLISHMSAQEGDRPVRVQLAATVLQDDQPEGTLPPVIVQPPEETLPEVEGTPPTTTPTDSSLSFPSLSDLRFGPSGPFGENRGILRSAKSLFDTPAGASIRTREGIQERQAADMFHALQNEVGVLMQSTAAGQASPFVRGLTGQQVLILVDGIRLNNSITRRGPNQYFNTIDPGMVDHIEVLRGQGSVLWGSDAIGGAINVVTRGPDTEWGMTSGKYSGGEFTQYYNTANSSPYSRLNVEGWVGNAGVFAGGSFSNIRDLDTGWDFGRQPGTNYQQWAGDIKFNYLLSESQMLTVSLQHFQQDDLPRSDRFPGYPGDLNNSNTFAKARFFDPQQRDLTYIRYQATEPIAAIDALTVTASYNRQRENQKRGVPTTR
ncbi:MAG: TonB-dependent receptor plug domain-containing protein, partial [Pirellulales bacterium]